METQPTIMEDSNERTPTIQVAGEWLAFFYVIIRILSVNV